VIDCLADTQIDIEVGFEVPLGMRVIPTFALRLPPAELQGALQPSINTHGAGTYNISSGDSKT
jgi:hypothetical protein